MRSTLHMEHFNVNPCKIWTFDILLLVQNETSPISAQLQE